MYILPYKKGRTVVSQSGHSGDATFCILRKRLRWLRSLEGRVNRTTLVEIDDLVAL